MKGKGKIRLIPPLVVLSTSSFFALYMYSQGYDFRSWLVNLLALMVLFLVFGLALEYMIGHFYEVNEKKQKIEEEKAKIIREAEDSLLEEGEEASPEEEAKEEERVTETEDFREEDPLNSAEEEGGEQA